MRRRIPALADCTPEEIAALVQKDPAHGRIICRCEQVSEAEVVATIRNSVGATSLDGIRRRTRAGSGRCQGGFCSPRVVEILSRELAIPREAVTKSGGASHILLEKLKP
jgi:glycerol-3-phosphate dehydrogenase